MVGRGSWVTTGLKTAFCVILGTGVLAGAGVAATPANSACTDTAAQTDVCTAAYDSSTGQRAPTFPTANSKILAKAAFTHDYDTVWNYLSPEYRAAVSHSKWLSCQKQNPVAPAGVTVKRISVSTAGNIPISLPQFGPQKVLQVQMQVLFTRQGADSAALVSAYWFHTVKNKWFAVWLPAVYSKYKSGGCDPLGLTRGLN
jgi:hypothetical protein